MSDTADRQALISAIAEETDRLTDQLIGLRRAIHAYPELGFGEVETAKRVCAAFDQAQIPYRSGVGGTGVIGLVAGRATGPGKTVGIRGDMDCLPIQEESGVPFASTRPGLMHACGHDVHTTIAVGTGLVLNALNDRFPGQAVLFLQPAEESLGGAQAMIADGALDDPPLDHVLGYHNWPPLDAGTVGWHPAVSFSASDGIDVVIKGTSGHAAHPHLAIDAITAAGLFVTQIQSVVSREVPPLSPAVLSFGTIQGGTARNQLPDQVVLTGTLRTQDEAVQDRIHAAIARHLDGLKTSLRIDYDLVIDRRTPVLRNDAATLARAVAAARDTLGADQVIELPQGTMGGEDFAEFTRRVPGAHLRLGAKIPGLDTMIHRSNYDCNEQAIAVGVRVMSLAAIDLMRGDTA